MDVSSSKPVDDWPGCFTATSVDRGKQQGTRCQVNIRLALWNYGGESLWTLTVGSSSRPARPDSVDRALRFSAFHHIRCSLRRVTSSWPAPPRHVTHALTAPLVAASSCTALATRQRTPSRKSFTSKA